MGSIQRLRDSNSELKLGLIYVSADRDLPLIQGFLSVLAKST